MLLLGSIRKMILIQNLIGRWAHSQTTWYKIIRNILWLYYIMHILCTSNVQNCSWCSVIMLWNSLCLITCFSDVFAKLSTSLRNVMRQLIRSPRNPLFPQKRDRQRGWRTTDNAPRTKKLSHQGLSGTKKSMEALQPFTPRREEDKIITLRRIAQHLSCRYQLYSNPTSTGVHGTTLHRYLWLLWKTCQTTYYLKNVKQNRLFSVYEWSMPDDREHITKHLRELLRVESHACNKISL